MVTIDDVVEEAEDYDIDTETEEEGGNYGGDPVDLSTSAAFVLRKYKISNGYEKGNLLMDKMSTQTRTETRES